jgi:hypothetical protein
VTPWVGQPVQGPGIAKLGRERIYESLGVISWRPRHGSWSTFGWPLPFAKRNAWRALRSWRGDDAGSAIIPNGFEGELQRQYHDVASVATNPPGMAAVLKLFRTSHLLFGSDLPYWTIASIADALNSMGLPSQDLQAIHRDNVLLLLPRLKMSGA